MILDPRTKNKTITTLLLIYQPPRILLGMKKRGFGAGRWNGFGGKIGKDEPVLEAAIRETREESGLMVLNPTSAGFLEFQWPHEEKLIDVHVYRASKYAGDLTETEEMMPRWFKIDEIPYDAMWADDKYWMPFFLKGKLFSGSFVFDQADNLLEYQLQEGKVHNI